MDHHNIQVNNYKNLLRFVLCKAHLHRMDLVGMVHEFLVHHKLQTNSQLGKPNKLREWMKTTPKFWSNFINFDFFFHSEFKCWIQWNRFLLGMGVQAVNGSPVYCSGQRQIAWWLWTMHVAYEPQTPMQGSLHLWLIQAYIGEHSPELTHSGRHIGGRPI